MIILAGGGEAFAHLLRAVGADGRGCGESKGIEVDRGVGAPVPFHRMMHARGGIDHIADRLSPIGGLLACGGDDGEVAGGGGREGVADLDGSA